MYVGIEGSVIESPHVSRPNPLLLESWFLDIHVVGMTSLANWTLDRTRQLGKAFFSKKKTQSIQRFTRLVRLNLDMPFLSEQYLGREK
jgi:hypothetical protein